MITSRLSTIKASRLKLVLIVTAIVASTITMSVFPANTNNNNAIAQSESFTQPVRVNVDKSSYVLGDYGLIIKNLNTGVQAIERYTDSYESPQEIYIDGSISARNGDSLTACVMNMSSEEMACDTQTAYYADDITNFFIDMADAQ
jgi:hypothetical protein